MILGKDRSVGVALACLLTFFELKAGEFSLLDLEELGKREYSKTIIMDSLLTIQKYRVVVRCLYLLF